MADSATVTCPWIVDIIPVRVPDGVDSLPSSYRAAWERYVGPVTPTGGDLEDWLEQAARLEAAVRLLPDVLVRVAGRRCDATDVDVMRCPHYGMVLNAPTLDAMLAAARSNADRYASFRSLRPFLGRDAETAVCEDRPVMDALHAMQARHPGEPVMVKFTGAVKRAPLVEVAPDGTFLHADPFDGTARRIPFDLWEWTGGAFGMEGAEDAVLIQQKIRMRHEYRMFMVGGQPVCGAGCIERHTPADNRGERFDARMGVDRGDGRIVSRPELAAGCALYASKVHEAIRDEVTGPYVMDLYTGGDGRPHVVELNGFSNAGLYALDMDALLTAVRDHPEEFTPIPFHATMAETE